jgi:hypothetical protein
MTLRQYHFVTLLALLANLPAAGQTVSRLDAGAGTGGSAFGWQPRVGLNGELETGSLGALRAFFTGAVDRVAAPATFEYDMLGGLRLASAPAATGWWIGGTAVHRNGFKDAVEQPRVEAGGWHRLGNVVVTIAAVRRRAAILGTAYSSHSIVTYNAYFDTVSGHWDSTRVVRTVGDSSRHSDMQRWAETEAAITWEGRRLSAELQMGGRLASRDVPAGAWASGDLAVRLSAPLSLVIGAGSSTGGRFALDAERRFVTLGFRVSPHLTSSVVAARPATRIAASSAFAIDALGAGRYRLSITAPRARAVEISGDFTSWKARRLERDADGRWALTLPLTAGTHRLNMRVDGGGWIAPPGLTTMSDDFAGEVGVLVIEDATK